MTEPTEQPQVWEPTQVLAPDGPATVEQVAAYLSMTQPNQELADTTAAVNAVVRRWRPVPANGQPWDADDVRGSVMLAGRFYRRKGSPGGVMEGAEGAVYVSRSDPDVAMLLRIGHYAEPVVG